MEGKREVVVEEIKEQINQLITAESKELFSEEVVKLSQQLDNLVVEQMREMNNVEK